MANNDITIRNVHGVEHGALCVRVEVGGALLRYLQENFNNTPVPGDPPTALPSFFACRADRNRGFVPVDADWLELDTSSDDDSFDCMVTDPAAESTSPCPTLEAICRDRGGSVYGPDGAEIKEQDVPNP